MDNYTRKARRAKVRLAAAGAAGCAVVAGLVLAAVSGGESDETAPPPARERSSSPAAKNPAGKDPEGKDFTPASAPAIPVMDPRTDKGGIGTGFEHSGRGASAAGITWWQDLDFLDDRTARHQLERIVSKDSPGSVDKRVSEVRTTREQAGLPPSGAIPAGLSFSTTVTAVLTRTLDAEGDIVAVWMQYDRYAQQPDKPADQDPLKDESARLVVKWEGGKNGDWTLTDEPRWINKAYGPRAYHPDSKYAFMDGWRRVNG